MRDKERKHGRRFLMVFGSVVLFSLLIAILPQFLNQHFHTHLDLGFWAFAGIAIVGFFVTIVGTPGTGALAGSLAGFLITMSGGVAFSFLQPGHPPDELRMVLSSAAIMGVLGAAIGFAGGLPVWLWRRLTIKHENS
jgi:hypothetical protein